MGEGFCQLFVIGNPRPQALVMPEHAQRPPTREFLLDQRGGAARREPQRMTGEINEFSSIDIAWKVKLVREGGERILLVEARRLLTRVARAVAQDGACMTVPQTLQVRCAALE
jgi:hypothetical protein